MNWRLLVDEPAEGAYNMAVDAALLEGVQAGGRPVLRLYRWEPACLSLGRNQPARGVYSADRAQERGVHIVRRPTGGLAVYHHHELTYAVVAAVGVLGRPRATYCAVNRALANGLRRLGVPAACATERPAGVAASAAFRTAPEWAGAPHPCFQEALAGEVTVHDRKLVGSAQRTERNTILQHGSILIAGDQSEVRTLEANPSFSIGPVCTSISEVLGRAPDDTELVDAIIAGFAEETGAVLQPDTLTHAEAARAAALREQYASEEWTWRK